MSRLRLVIVGLFVAACAAIGYVSFGGRPDAPPALTMEEMLATRQASRDEVARYLLFDALTPVRLANCAFERFGESNDGGYLLCANLLEGVEAGYSYGISNYDKWGCDIATKLDVDVHQYDCFDTRQPACPTGRTVFHPECISAEPFTEEGRAFDTLASQLRKNGDEGRRVVVKMDVEGAEWDSLLFAPDDVLDRIDQLAIEMHGVSDPKFATAVQRLNKFFYVANIHFNNFSCQNGIDPFPAWAYEVLFVNKRLGVVDSGGETEAPPGLDAPNKPELTDCQEWRP